MNTKVSYLIFGFYFTNLLFSSMYISCNLFSNYNFYKLYERIVGGTAAKPGQFPYQVIIYKYKGESLNIHCGGVILNAYHVITAGHCILMDGIRERPSNLIVKSGDIDLHSVKIKSFAVSKIFVHKRFQVRDYDIAVLRLKSPFPINHPSFTPVDLNTHPVPEGTLCTVSGWGVDKFSAGRARPPNQLQYAVVHMLNRNKCGKRYAQVAQITPRMVCTGYHGAPKDACVGDSGGPLVCDGKLVGIVSWAMGCALKDFPGVYTNVALLRNWILSVSQLNRHKLKSVSQLKKYKLKNGWNYFQSPGHYI